MTDFYLTLPSNSSLEYYPNNTITQYTTQLPNLCRLDGDWEAGLIEIQYPRTWYNILGPVSKRTVRITDPPEERESGTFSYSFEIPAGYYPTPQSLIGEIEKLANITLSAYNQEISLKYDPITQKVSLDETTNILSFPPNIARMLGLATNKLGGNNPLTGSRVVDIELLDTLFVYCDVIEPQVVGDKLVPLLRIVPVTGERGTMISHEYQRAQYRRLQKKQFQSIEIDIRDHVGNKVPFERGTLNVTLHFRQRKRFSTL